MPSPRLTIAISSVTIIDATWTTAHLAHAATVMGIPVRMVEPSSFEVTSAGRLVARGWVPDAPAADRETFTEQLNRCRLPCRYIEINDRDLLLLRVNPLTMSMLSIALIAQGLGATVINDPLGIARTRSKAWLATLTDVPRPQTVVTTSRATAHAFAHGAGSKVIVKPATSSGGRGVSLVRTRDTRALDEAIENARFQGGGHVVVQEYLAAADQGEKRLFWIDGRIIGAYLRRRPPGEFRHNLRNGAQPEFCQVEASDMRIAEAVGPHLARNGIRIAGLDVIGDRLVEVNTLNPGGLHYAAQLGGQAPGTLAAEALRSLLPSPNEALREATPA